MTSIHSTWKTFNQGCSIWWKRVNGTSPNDLVPLPQFEISPLPSFSWRVENTSPISPMPLRKPKCLSTLRVSFPCSLFFIALFDLNDVCCVHVCMVAWWLSPELFLRRPPEQNEEFRLDSILKRKAEQGVHIYVILYKELSTFLPYDSAHTKEVLNGLHENIVVVRHPDPSISSSHISFFCSCFLTSCQPLLFRPKK